MLHISTWTWWGGLGPGPLHSP